MAGWYQYKYAVVRQIPDSYKTLCIRMNAESAIDLDKARAQHGAYIQALGELGITVLRVPADERYPDCVFVEDNAIVIGNTALICRPGASTRVGEESAIREILRQEPLSLNIIEMEDPDATIEGGDVMFTGTEILVGLSKRTNEKGVAELAKAFPDYPVTSANVLDGSLHLKSVMTMIGDGTIAISQTKYGQALKSAIVEKAKSRYKFIELPEDAATNVLLVNGKVVHVAEAAIPQSWATLQDYNKLPRVVLDISEMQKADGCLSCCSILIN